MICSVLQHPWFSFAKTYVSVNQFPLAFPLGWCITFIITNNYLLCLWCQFWCFIILWIYLGSLLLLTQLVSLNLCCCLMEKKWILLDHWLCLVLVFVSALISVMSFLLLDLDLFVLRMYIRLLIRSVSILREDFSWMLISISALPLLSCAGLLFWVLFFCESVLFVLAHGYSSSWLPQKLVFKKNVQSSYSVSFSVFVMDF